jgi:hypothetical protein
VTTAHWRLPVAAAVIVRWCKDLDVIFIMFRIALYFLGASIIDLDPSRKKKELAFLNFGEVLVFVTFAHFTKEL